MAGMAAYHIRIRYTHGIVMYLNAKEIYRSQMPAGAVDPSTEATMTGSYIHT